MLRRPQAACAISIFASRTNLIHIRKGPLRGALFCFARDLFFKDIKQLHGNRQQRGVPLGIHEFAHGAEIAELHGLWPLGEDGGGFVELSGGL